MSKSLRRLAYDIGIPLLLSKLVVLVVMGVVIYNAKNQLSWEAFRSAFHGWDAASYTTIATDGYPACVTCKQGYLLAFLPGFPFLIRGGTSLGLDPVLAGVLINVVAEGAALFFVYRLVELERDAKAGRFVAWCLAFSPFAIFLTTVYTESLFIAAAAASLYWARSGKQVHAVTACAVACFTRVTGAAIVPALMLEEILRRKRLTWDALFPIAGVIPLGLFWLFLRSHTGVATAFTDVNQHFFNHTFAPPWRGFGATLNLFNVSDKISDRFIWLRELVGGVGGLVVVGFCVVWTARRRLAPSLLLYTTLAWLLAVCISFWLSVGRYDLALFPAFLILADLTRRYWILRPVIVTASAGLMVWGTAIYAGGAWLA